MYMGVYPLYFWIVPCVNLVQNSQHLFSFCKSMTDLVYPSLYEKVRTLCTNFSHMSLVFSCGSKEKSSSEALTNTFPHTYVGQWTFTLKDVPSLFIHLHKLSKSILTDSILVRTHLSLPGWPFTKGSTCKAFSSSTCRWINSHVQRNVSRSSMFTWGPICLWQLMEHSVHMSSVHMHC